MAAQQNQVGFSFQGDVVSGGSLLHAATGRLLKALSDGGVDFYAVAAAFQLGKTIPIPPTRESEITALVNNRTGRAGVLTKLLSIGWGHSDVAVELAKTRAGASALVTLGALATGSSTYVAAQGFTELLMLAGCAPEMIPTVDVAKPMIAYLSPFVSDSGFKRVLENITSTAKSGCLSAGKGVPQGLIATGDVPRWARALHQMVFTASNGEEIYLIANQRGAWLATWASYILGMAVKLMFDDLLLWEAAGPQGAVVLQLGSPGVRPPAIKQFELIPPPQTADGQKALVIDYALKDALAKELRLDPRVDENISNCVKLAVVRLFGCFLRAVRMKSAQRDSGTSHWISGMFDVSRTFSRGCADLGISDQIVASGRSKFQRIKPWSGNSLQDHGLQYLNTEGANELRDACGAHKSSNTKSRIAFCLCCRIGGLIHATAATAAALALCVYNADQIRVRADIMSGQLTTAWSRAIILDDGHMDHGYATSTQALTHISQLLHGLEAIQDTEISSGKSLLAVSAGATTVYYRAILDAEAFDMDGKAVAIASGRLSFRGVLRKTVVEARAAYDAVAAPQTPFNTDAMWTKIAPGVLIEPAYAKGPMETVMDILLGEREMLFQCYARSTSPQSSCPPVPIEILRCIHNLMQCRFGRRCKHDHDRAHKPSERSQFEITSFFSTKAKFLIGYHHDENRDRVFHALKGNRLEQLIQAILLVVEEDFYQGDACLSCAVSETRNRPYGDIVMT